jgi:hypothetical protein
MEELINPANWTWPQYTYLAIAAVGLSLTAMLSGVDRTGKHSFPVSFVGALISAFLLVFGGFYA